MYRIENRSENSVHSSSIVEYVVILFELQQNNNFVERIQGKNRIESSSARTGNISIYSHKNDKNRIDT